jgi:hypothetical protein
MRYYTNRIRPKMICYLNVGEFNIFTLRFVKISKKFRISCCLAYQIRFRIEFMNSIGRRTSGFFREFNPKFSCR